MAAYTTLLLIITLCVATVHSLKCYTCESESTNANCLTATQCDSNTTSCLTSVGSASYGGVSLVSIIKRCAASCSPTTINIAGVTGTVTCCSSDLCNTSGGVSIKSSCAAIILALGSILTILRGSVL